MPSIRLLLSSKATGICRACRFVKAKPLPRYSNRVILAVLSHFCFSKSKFPWLRILNTRVFADAHDTLVLVIEIDVDGEVAAQPPLVSERPGEVKLVILDAPGAQSSFRSSPTRRVAVRQNRDVVTLPTETGGQAPKELGVLVKQTVDVEAESHACSGGKGAVEPAPALLGPSLSTDRVVTESRPDNREGAVPDLNRPHA